VPRVWRVVSFTFSAYAAAQKKAQQINEKWPSLHAEVFKPRSRHTVYLVALGGRMTREEALRVQRDARAQGLPRDTYVQNYSE
jgi:hypothetical protein